MPRRRAITRTPAAIGTATLVTVGLALAGCTAETTSTETAEPTTTAESTPSATAEATTDVVALAEAFAATLDADQQASLFQEYTFDNAANWSNFPNALLAGGGPGAQSSSGGSGGLQTDSLTDEQWTALEDLLRAVTGSAENEGFDEIVQHLAGDDYLADNGGGSDYGEGQFFVAFLGTPSDSGT